jgi:hypothetical protein
VAPAGPRRAYVDGFALRIGQRATLLPSAGLREAPRPQERNPDYAGRLRRALTKLEFPPEYIASVA